MLRSLPSRVFRPISVAAGYLRQERAGLNNELDGAMHRSFKLSRPRLDDANMLALIITFLGLVAFVMHADSPASAWCALHIIPLPFLGWLTADLPLPVMGVVVLLQVVLGFALWSFVFRITLRLFFEGKRRRLTPRST